MYWHYYTPRSIPLEGLGNQSLHRMVFWIAATYWEMRVFLPIPIFQERGDSSPSLWIHAYSQRASETHLIACPGVKWNSMRLTDASKDTQREGFRFDLWSDRWQCFSSIWNQFVSPRVLLPKYNLILQGNLSLLMERETDKQNKIPSSVHRN